MNKTVEKMMSVVSLIEGNCKLVELGKEVYIQEVYVLVGSKITTLKDAVENALSTTSGFAKAVSTASGVTATGSHGIAKFEKNNSSIEIKFFDANSIVRIDHDSETTMEMYKAGEQWSAYNHVLMALTYF